MHMRKKQRNQSLTKTIVILSTGITKRPMSKKYNDKKKRVRANRELEVLNLRKLEKTIEKETTEDKF